MLTVHFAEWEIKPTLCRCKADDECLLLAQSGHAIPLRSCPLSGIKRTSRGGAFYRYHRLHATRPPLPAALDDRRIQRRVLRREGRARTDARLFLFRR